MNINLRVAVWPQHAIPAHIVALNLHHRHRPWYMVARPYKLVTRVSSLSLSSLYTSNRARASPLPSPNPYSFSPWCTSAPLLSSNPHGYPCSDSSCLWHPLVSLELILDWDKLSRDPLDNEAVAQQDLSWPLRRARRSCCPITLRTPRLGHPRRGHGSFLCVCRTWWGGVLPRCVHWRRQDSNNVLSGGWIQ